MWSYFYNNEQIRPYEIGKQSFGYSGFILSPMNTYIKY